MEKPNIPISRPLVGSEELEAVGKIFETGWLGLGSAVYEFENELKKFLDTEHVIAVNTGTSALHIAIAGLGISEGDEVIVPSMTFCGSIQPIIACGGKPVLCEVEEDTLNIDVEDVKKRITPKTKAVMAVHYGKKLKR